MSRFDGEAAGEAEGHDRSEALRSDFDRVAVNGWLGTRLLSCRRDLARLALPPRAEFLQETGVVQGGILAALADTAAVYALWPDLAPGMGMTGVEFKLNFLRPARLDDGEIVASARVVRRGTTLGVVDVDLEQQGRIVATGIFTFLFFSRERS